ncbi:nuclear pore complex component [Ophiocordyceps sinensis CO18]|uniref:Nuclear pore complex component n=1 Tax=Ophiocordyceps sinensis (strain Co18 / CGMCC 3.14243) TaxID=911162 RepID=T5AC25_OPHSC|nr:nuclear pore complex component [Ophiocordyceps sinensis CO18]
MATPVKSTRADVSPIPDSPGTWRHPRLNEITRRRNAATFSEKNVRRIACNVIALLVMWSLQLLARLKVDLQMFSSTFSYYMGWAWFAMQLLPFIQIGLACLPLVRAQDDLSDIALTATQRKLLGLPATSVPLTPEARYSTPPRYSRTPSIAGSVGSRASYNSSPLSGRGSPALSVGGSPSPFSASGSHLLQRSVGGLAQNRRSSLGSSSTFGASSSANLFGDTGSPSPSTGKRTSVGLNSKWLYEREVHKRWTGRAREHALWASETRQVRTLCTCGRTNLDSLVVSGLTGASGGNGVTEYGSSPGLVAGYNGVAIN